MIRTGQLRDHPQARPFVAIMLAAVELDERMRERAMAALKAICDECGQRVADGDGSLCVDLDEVSDVEKERGRARTTSHGDRMVFENALESLGSAALAPEPARWQVLHSDCDPNPDGNYYSISLARIRTWPALAEWTAHLMRKEWLRHTDWDQVLYAAARGLETRITPTRKRDTTAV